MCELQISSEYPPTADLNRIQTLYHIKSNHNKLSSVILYSNFSINKMDKSHAC